MNKENVKNYNEDNPTATIGLDLASVKAEFEKIENVVNPDLTVNLK